MIALDYMNIIALNFPVFFLKVFIAFAGIYQS